MSHCQQGEKAHLWINGNEHWIFDGPIDVSVEYIPGQEQDPAPRPGVTTYVVRWIQPPGQNFYPEATFILNSWLKTEVVPITTTQATLRFKIGTPFSARSKVYGGSRTSAMSVSTDQNGDRWAATGIYTGYPYYFQYYTGDFLQGLIPKVATDGTYRLTVKKGVLTLLTRDFPQIPSYVVKCGDRCPPGQVWDQKCGQCVCEGMGGIKAGLKGALSVARSIKP
jgi:hypothetical protein